MSGSYFVLFALPGSSSRSRLGITATRKYGTAVTRNRIKRIVRELFRRHRSTGAPIDLVVNVKAAAAGADVTRLDRDFAERLAELHRKVAP